MRTYLLNAPLGLLSGRDCCAGFLHANMISTPAVLFFACTKSSIVTGTPGICQHQSGHPIPSTPPPPPGTGITAPATRITAPTPEAVSEVSHFIQSSTTGTYITSFKTPMIHGHQPDTRVTGQIKVFGMTLRNQRILLYFSMIFLPTISRAVQTFSPTKFSAGTSDTCTNRTSKTAQGSDQN